MFFQALLLYVCNIQYVCRVYMYVFLICIFMVFFSILSTACGRGRTNGWPPQPEVSIPAVQGGEELLVKLQERLAGFCRWMST